MYVSLHVKYQLLLSDFNETWIFYTDFMKMHAVEIEFFHVEWQTDMMKLPVTFHNFGGTYLKIAFYGLQQ